MAKLSFNVGGSYPGEWCDSLGIINVTVYHSLEVYLSEAVGS